MRRTIRLAMLLFVPLAANPVQAEPRQLPEKDLAGITGGLLDFYYVAPVVVVSSSTTSQATAQRGSSSQAATASNINVNTNVIINSINSLSNWPTDANAGSNPQTPVWVPWKQELRPLASFMDLLATPPR